MDIAKEALHVFESRIDRSNLIFRRVDSPQLIKELFRLRYQVYCIQCNLLRPQDYPEGLESDKYDPHSIHFSASDNHGVAGTIRLVLDSQYGFPLEENCRGKLNIDLNVIPRNNVAEISRYIIDNRVKDYSEIYSGSKDVARLIRTIALGIFREMYIESKRIGITHWIALMERRLYVLMRRYGFEFTPIGEDVNVSGIVRPYMVRLGDLEQKIYKHGAELRGGALSWMR